MISTRETVQKGSIKLKDWDRPSPSWSITLPKHTFFTSVLKVMLPCPQCWVVPQWLCLCTIFHALPFHPVLKAFTPSCLGTILTIWSTNSSINCTTLTCGSICFTTKWRFCSSSCRITPTIGTLGESSATYTTSLTFLCSTSNCAMSYFHSLMG